MSVIECLCECVWLHTCVPVCTSVCLWFFFWFVPSYVVLRVLRVRSSVPASLWKRGEDGEGEMEAVSSDVPCHASMT